jgi:hypothetical protein
VNLRWIKTEEGKPSILDGMSGPFVFKCPATSQHIQGYLDDDDNAREDEYEAVACPGVREAALLQSQDRQDVRARKRVRPPQLVASLAYSQIFCGRFAPIFFLFVANLGAFIQSV